jgi:hypothetical protein
MSKIFNSTALWVLKAVLLFSFIATNANAWPWPSPPKEGPKKEPHDPILVNEVSWGLKEIRHVRVVFNQDPSKTAEIIWKANLKNVNLYLDTVDHGEKLEKYSTKIEAKKLTNYRNVISASVSLNNLTPNTKYYFVIEDGKIGYTSKRYWFKTTSDSTTDPLYVVAGGDSRNNRVVRRKSNILVKKLRPDVVFFGGDFTVRGWHDQWLRWFDDWSFTYGDDGRITPIVVARGNHEYRAETLELLFNAPLETYYDVSFHGGLLNLYVLNTEISMGGNQLEWLKGALLKTKDYLWNYSIYHRSTRPHTSSKSEGWQQYKFWAPLFYGHGLDLVIESDTHVMKTTWPIRPSQDEGNIEGYVRDDLNGIVYVGEGTWGAPLKPMDDAKEWTRASGSVNQIKWLKVTEQDTTIRTVLSENALDVGTVKDEAKYLLPLNISIYEGDGGEIKMLQRELKLKEYKESKTKKGEL